MLGDRARGLLTVPEPPSLAQAGRFEILDSVAVGADLRIRLRRPLP